MYTMICVAMLYLWIKKPIRDLFDIKSFRRISNLSFVSKIIERLVVDRFNAHISTYHLLQSAYRLYHSTETAITIVHNDIVHAIDDGNVSIAGAIGFKCGFGYHRP